MDSVNRLGGGGYSGGYSRNSGKYTAILYVCDPQLFTNTTAEIQDCLLFVHCTGTYV